eukprot:gnl/TRDRNA2_/TRDRNA2_173923_c0_seq1.p1 gnl/TRDRNA2_/TRDRNA2_173923_c0~~gnl/TRDRNA2_/TRDRNA2_173923_c0_seq1.p1  ORF type:complete len:200 (-),score=17.67 gnl/TRDRNA2_/TRDRNA2_173923_c0_seq1:254-853(-)
MGLIKSYETILNDTNQTVHVYWGQPHDVTQPLDPGGLRMMEFNVDWPHRVCVVFRLEDTEDDYTSSCVEVVSPAEENAVSLFKVSVLIELGLRPPYVNETVQKVQQEGKTRKVILNSFGSHATFFEPAGADQTDPSSIAIRNSTSIVPSTLLYGKRIRHINRNVPALIMLSLMLTFTRMKKCHINQSPAWEPPEPLMRI